MKFYCQGKSTLGNLEFKIINQFRRQYCSLRANELDNYSDSYMNRSTRFVSLKLQDFPFFDSLSFLLKFIFLFSKMNSLFDFKTS